VGCRMKLMAEMRGMKQLSRKLALARLPPHIIEQNLKIVARIMQREAKLMLREHVDEGTLRDAISVFVLGPMKIGVGVSLRDVPYAAAIEFGRRPSARMPSTRQLALSRKFRRKTQRELFALAKAIHERGTKAYPYLRPAYQKHKDKVQEAFARRLSVAMMARIK